MIYDPGELSMVEVEEMVRFSEEAHSRLARLGDEVWAAGDGGGVSVQLKGGTLWTSAPVLAALSDFAKEVLREATSSSCCCCCCGDVGLVMPDVDVDDFRLFLEGAFRPSRSSAASRKEERRRTKKKKAATAARIKLEKATERIGEVLRLRKIDFGASVSSSSSSSSGENASSSSSSVCLSDVDIFGLSDETIEDNFADQHARLVCLVCYKIFPPGEHAAYKSHVGGHRAAALKRVRLKDSSSAAGKRGGQETVKDEEELVVAEPPKRALKVLAEPKTLPAKVAIPKLEATRKRKRASVGGTSSSDLGGTTCQYCGKTFVDRTRLRVHQRIHFDLRPFACPTCGKAFTQARTLAEHSRTHEAGRRLRCEICDKEFVQPNHLRSHRASEHGIGADHGCAECGKRFAFACQLARHAKTHNKK